MAFTYPDAHRSDVTDDYHGQVVADPYRWLEDPESAETKAFVAAQNAITMPYLESLPDRKRLQARMTELWDTPRTGIPTVRSGVAIWSFNDGLADQAAYYLADFSLGVKSGESGEAGQPDGELFLDPNTMSDDGAVAVVVTSLSPDGRLFAYTVSEAGSDRQVLRIRSTQTGEDLDDELHHLRFTSVAWFGDGFFYTRFPESDPASTEPVRDQQVYYHRVGDAQGDDRLIYRNADDPEPVYGPFVTHDDRYLVLHEYLGTSRHNGVLYLDLQNLDLQNLDLQSLEIQSLDSKSLDRGRPGAASGLSVAGWVRLVDQGQATHNVVLHDQQATPGGLFIVQTNDGSPNGTVVGIPLDRPDERIEIVAESAEPIEWVAGLAGSLVVCRLVEASNNLVRYRTDGSIIGPVELPGVGTVVGASGRFVDNEFYLDYQSFVEPPTALRLQADNDASQPEVSLFAKTEPPIDPARFSVERHHATSSDGANVGMFVIKMIDTYLPAPVELYGYGGFSINLTPTYSPARLAFLESGGVVVVANLRGGTEQGEDWHQQGMLANKQQVFDDFIACGQHLINAEVTTPAQLGIRGGSNGGLLTAAAIVQRPDLFGAVVSQVPVTDMLRYQHFTAGRYWTVEYGDSAEPDAFGYLIKYSPLHNVEEGAPVDYPALLITTAESDDRVVPMHSHKLAAEIQHRVGGHSQRPLLERVETRAGHGLGKPTTKIIEEAADIYAFLLANLVPAT